MLSKNGKTDESEYTERTSFHQENIKSQKTESKKCVYKTQLTKDLYAEYIKNF